MVGCLTGTVLPGKFLYFSDLSFDADCTRAPRDIGQQTMAVDLDKDKGRPDSNGRNTHRVQVRMSKKLDLYPLQAYLQGQAAFDVAVLEAMTFMDHLLRVYPSQQLLSIKRSFFAKTGAEMKDLSNGVIAMKGVYQSLRAAQGGQLIINADVANSCFWDSNKTLYTIATEILPKGYSHYDMCHELHDQPKRPGGRPVETPLARQLKRLKKVRFRVEYTNQPESNYDKTYVVDELIGTNAFDYKFEQKNAETGQTRTISIRDYFLDRYQSRLFAAEAPMVKTKRGAVYPMEYCIPVAGERFPFKIDEYQTAEMIKFAVTKPDVRAASVYKGTQALKWKEDPYLNHYKMKIDDKMLTTNARLLQPPEVEFGKGKTEKPGTAGRWRIDGKHFIEPANALKHWGVMILDNFGRGRSIQLGPVQQFIANFIGEYQKYGGTVINRSPVIETGEPDIANSVEKLWNSVARKCTPPERPQILFFVVNAKSTDPYNRLKKNCDCRFGVVSQVLQGAHVQKNQAQYIGNVLMKVNAKLGGFSFRSLSAGAKPNTSYTHFKVPTMIIGGDVSHPGPGSLGASMAALTISLDKFGGRYAAACQSNGSRIEMITTWNFEDMLKKHFLQWVDRFKTFPKHIIYMRDGVSEGQYQHVLHQEVRDLKAVFENFPNGKAMVAQMKFTVLVCSKRHHIRFFPKAPNKDNNNNPLPGTLVERDVTTPFLWDFYLCAHRAIQGTARPVHYAVLMDEAKVTPDWLVKMIYEHSYQYVRSSTPVSVHPAIYYAHLAARRAVAHERTQGIGDSGPRTADVRERDELIEIQELANQTGKRMNQSAIKRLQDLTQLEYPTLIDMLNTGRIKETMWYV